jgi:hypothetical protein
MIKRHSNQQSWALYRFYQWEIRILHIFANLIKTIRGNTYFKKITIGHKCNVVILGDCIQCNEFCTLLNSDAPKKLKYLTGAFRTGDIDAHLVHEHERISITYLTAYNEWRNWRGKFHIWTFWGGLRHVIVWQNLKPEKKKCLS